MDCFQVVGLGKVCVKVRFRKQIREHFESYIQCVKKMVYRLRKKKKKKEQKKKKKGKKKRKTLLNLNSYI
jgi:hypothetical protein